MEQYVYMHACAYVCIHECMYVWMYTIMSMAVTYMTFLDCGAPPSINLTCGHNQVNASWDSGGCAHSLCKGYLNCTNGIGSPYLSEVNY